MLPILTTSLIHFSLTLSTPKSDQFQISPAAPPEFRIVFDRHTHKRTPKNAEYVWTVAVFGEKKSVFENSCVGVDKASFKCDTFESHLSVPELEVNTNIGMLDRLFWSSLPRVPFVSSGVEGEQRWWNELTESFPFGGRTFRVSYGGSGV